MYVTQHAAERFQKRFAPALPLGHCMRELKTLAETATRRRERGKNGEMYLDVTDGSRMVLVLKRDVCVTVLFGDGGDEEESDPLEPGA